MPIILAHGQPKSGSSFLFQVADRAARTRNGAMAGEMRTYLSRVLDRQWDNFHETVSLDLVRTLLERVDPSLYVTVKTHGRFDEALRPLVARGVVIAFSSVRDPRDSALSMLNTGARDREEGRERGFFKSLHSIEQPETLGAQRHASAILATYARQPFIRIFPHESLAVSQPRVTKALLDHLGLGIYFEEINAFFGADRKQKILEYNKGEAFRFAAELDPACIARLTESLSVEIKRSEHIIRKGMDQLGMLLHFFALRSHYRQALPRLAA